MLKLGSLFDGSGTAPLAARMCGITPIWASEIEPYAIRVTQKNFPKMLHLGDITKIHGDAVEPVDIIAGGSPCQDLSVAGKQAGLNDGKRSHLFYEMTRIIREMRDKTNGVYPRYVVWENVPGAFSSNRGRDFLSVLQTFASLAENDVYVPEPEKIGRGTDGLAWKASGEMVGDGWSLAWRTVDAQFWGVPQRRRRIYLILDFADECAGEILFERKGVSGNNQQGGTQRETAAENAERSARRDDSAGFIGKSAASAGSIGYFVGGQRHSKRDIRTTLFTRQTEPLSEPVGLSECEIVHNGKRISNIRMPSAVRRKQRRSCIHQRSKAMRPSQRYYSQSGYRGYAEIKPCIRSSGGDLGGGKRSSHHSAASPERLTQIITEGRE